MVWDARVWGAMGDCGRIWEDVGCYGEMWDVMGKCGMIWDDVG